MSKYIVLRNDDVADEGGCNWLTPMINSKGIKATYSVMPSYLADGDFVDYLNGLSSNFELGTHGYTHDWEENIADKRYKATRAIAEEGHNLMVANVATPLTFIPCFGVFDSTGVAVLRDLGYETICSSDAMLDFTVWQEAEYLGVRILLDDFGWEYWNPEINLHTYLEFKAVFDDWYDNDNSISGDNYFTILCHSWAFCGNESAQTAFANSIDYMKTKDVTFITVKQI